MAKKQVKYVLGFLFDDTLRDVVLIRKQKPDWQAGRLNGVGGKIKAKEPMHAAMEREFVEETGVRMPQSNWLVFGQLVNEEWLVHCFVARSTVALKACRTLEREAVVKARWGTCREPIVPNLTWLVPMAIDATSAHKGIFGVVHYMRRGNEL